MSVVVPTATADRTSRSQTILRSVTATFPEQRVAVLGANGSGKSTMARLINALTLPSTGQVKVNGSDTRVASSEVRSQVGFLFADATAQVIMPTPVEDVAISLRRVGVKRADRTGRALEILDRFGLADQAFQPVHTLSGGQTQLLALATMLALEPKALVCDEPTTRLDLYWRERLIEELLTLDTQLVVVTHDLDFATQFERGVVLDEANLVADGTGSDAVTDYRELISAKHGSRS